MAHAARFSLAMAEVAHQVVVASAKTRGDEFIQGRAQRFLAGAPEDLLGGAVEQHHALRLVDRDDGVHGRLHDGGEPGVLKGGGFDLGQGVRVVRIHSGCHA